jgi:hypothetical protein
MYSSNKKVDTFCKTLFYPASFHLDTFQPPHELSQRVGVQGHHAAVGEEGEIEFRLVPGFLARDRHQAGGQGFV